MIKRNALICAALIATATTAGDTTYTVIKHDNLWNLSGQYLSNPFYWPQIWNANPQIKNPHLIYPGDQIKIPAELAAQAAAGTVQSGTTMSKEQIASGLQSYYLNNSDLYSYGTLATAPYITPENFTEFKLGTISDDSRQIFGMNATVNVKTTGKVSVGETVDVVHQQKATSTVNGKKSLIIPVGSATIVSVQDQTVKMRITAGWDKISNGDAIIVSRQFGTYQNPSIDLGVNDVESSVLVRVNANEIIKPFEKLIIEGGTDKNIRIGDIFIAAEIDKKGNLDTEPAFRGIVIRSDSNSSTLLVEEVRKHVSSDNFKLKRAARLNFK